MAKMSRGQDRRAQRLGGEKGVGPRNGNEENLFERPPADQMDLVENANVKDCSR